MPRAIYNLSSVNGARLVILTGKFLIGVKAVPAPLSFTS